LVTEDAIDDGDVGADGGERQVQSSEELTLWVVWIAGELGVGDVDASGVPAVDGK